MVVPDWPGIGRSGSIPLDELTGEVVVEGLSGLIRMLDQPIVLMVHSMSGCYGWRLAELHGSKIVSVIGVTPSQPGNIQDEGKVLNETGSFLEIETFGRTMIIDKGRLNLPSDETILTKYVGDSKFFPRDRIPAYKVALLGLPPRILAQRRNIRGSQVRLSDPSRLSGQKVLVVTGTADIDHPRELDEGIVTWLNSLGAKADFYYLEDHGIEGNGHMLMLETNSSAVASLMLRWLDASLSG